MERAGRSRQTTRMLADWYVASSAYRLDHGVAPDNRDVQRYYIDNFSLLRPTGQRPFTDAISLRAAAVQLMLEDGARFEAMDHTELGDLLESLNARAFEILAPQPLPTPTR